MFERGSIELKNKLEEIKTYYFTYKCIIIETYREEEYLNEDYLIKNKTQINKIGKQIYVLIHNKKKEELNNISYLLFDIIISKSNLDNQLGELIRNCIK